MIVTAWRIAPEAALCLRRWGDEFVVHHALSNDTHRLDLHGGLVLAALSSADTPLTPLEIATRVGVGLGADAADDTLAALAELGFVTPC